jgi:alpha-amylase
MKQNLLSLVILLFAATVTFAQTPTVTPTPTVLCVVIRPMMPSIPVGATLQLTLEESLTTWPWRTVTATSWTSSDTKVATVSSTGLVTAVAAGTSTIKATFNGMFATEIVTSTPPVSKTK